MPVKMNPKMFMEVFSMLWVWSFSVVSSSTVAPSVSPSVSPTIFPSKLPTISPTTAAPTVSFMPTAVSSVWTKTVQSPLAIWAGMDSSSDGQYVYAMASHGSNASYQVGLYMSNNYGVNFLASPYAFTYGNSKMLDVYFFQQCISKTGVFTGVACSNDGSFVVAGNSKSILISTDFGVLKWHLILDVSPLIIIACIRFRCVIYNHVVSLDDCHSQSGDMQHNLRGHLCATVWECNLQIEWFRRSVRCFVCTCFQHLLLCGVMF